MLTAASYKEMTTAIRVHEMKDEDYGLGLWMKPEQGPPVIRHNGGIDDFESSLIYLPERKMTLVILMLGVLFGSAHP